jgi:hypothetical protein
MKVSVLLSMALSSAAAAADSVVPPEILGVWAKNPQGCNAKNPGVLRISESGVDLENAHGRIQAGAYAFNKTIEVIFQLPTRGAKAHDANVRTYRLSNDGLNLMELHGDQVLATWTKCRNRNLAE